MAEKFLGYNFCGPVDGSSIPQRLQNLCIRDYAKGKGLVVSFSVSEHLDSSQSMMLFAQLEHLSTISGFIFFSLLMLPEDQEKRIRFYQCLAAAGCSIHFALEDLSAKREEDFAFIEKLYRISTDKRMQSDHEARLAHFSSARR